MCARGRRFLCTLLVLFCFSQAVVYADTTLTDSEYSELLSLIRGLLTESKKTESSLTQALSDLATVNSALSLSQSDLQRVSVDLEISKQQLEELLRSLRRRTIALIATLILLAAVTAVAIWR